MAWSTYLAVVFMILAFMAVFILVLRAMVSVDTYVGSMVSNITNQLNSTYGPLPSDPLHLNPSSWANALTPLTTLLNYAPLIMIIAIVLALAFSRRR